TRRSSDLNNAHGFNNTAEGFDALFHSTGSNNIAVGANAGINLTTGSNNIDIGAPGTAGEANTIRIGKLGTQNKTFIAGISGKTVASGVGVIINSNGQLGTVQSSARFKTGIKPMDKTSAATKHNPWAQGGDGKAAERNRKPGYYRAKGGRAGRQK